MLQLLIDIWEMVLLVASYGFVLVYTGLCCITICIYTKESTMNWKYRFSNWLDDPLRPIPLTALILTVCMSASVVLVGIVLIKVGII